MSSHQKVYIIAYDICDPRRLRRVYRTMRGFGDHVQYSVFRCVLSDVQRERMVDRLCDEIHHDEDQVLIIPLGSADSRRAWQAETLGLPLTCPERWVSVI